MAKGNGICAFHGTYPNNGAGVNIDTIFDVGTSLEVVVTRYTGDGMLPVVTNPYHIVKTAYSDLPVNFNVNEVNDPAGLPGGGMIDT